MKILLRSCFISEATDDQELFARNFISLMHSGLGFETPEDQLIWTFISDFFRDHTHIPSISTIRTHFERIRETTTVDRLELLGSVKPITGGDFVRHLETKAEDRRARLVLDCAKTMAKIVETGFEVQDGKNKKFLKGSVDAARWFQEKSHEVIAPTFGTRLSGDILGDTAGFKERYEKIEADPEYAIGQFSGIEQLDLSTQGAKKGELWTHAAFTGGMKSSLALQWAYNQAIRYRHSVVFFSLEMPYMQCQNMVHCMHTFHEKFRDIRVKLGIQAASKKQSDGTWVHYDRGLDYEKIKNGKLEPHEKEFLFKYVEPDLDDASNGYGALHLEVANPDKSDFTVADLRIAAELLYAKDPFRMIIVDHMGLMAPRKWMRSTTENLNEVIRDLKRLAMSFNRGMGIAVLGLFQISREGYKAAEKSDGRYNLTHLSYANECERSSDIVTAGWIDDTLKAQGKLYVQCWKSRDSAPFERFSIRVEWHCRRLLTCHDGIENASESSSNSKTNEEVGNSIDAEFSL